MNDNMTHKTPQAIQKYVSKSRIPRDQREAATALLIYLEGYDVTQVAHAVKLDDRQTRKLISEGKRIYWQNSEFNSEIKRITIEWR